MDHVDNSGNRNPQNPENEHSVDPQNTENVFTSQSSTLANDGYEEQFDLENLEKQFRLAVEVANNMYEQLSRELTKYVEDIPLPEDHLCQENENVFLDHNVNSINLIENHGETVSIPDDEVVPSSTLGHGASYEAERLGDQTDIGEDDNHSHPYFGSAK